MEIEVSVWVKCPNCHREWYEDTYAEIEPEDIRDLD